MKSTFLMLPMQILINKSSHIMSVNIDSATNMCSNVPHDSALVSCFQKFDLTTGKKGSGCGSVGRAVASDTRGPQFESSHRQKFIYVEHLFTVNFVLKRRK